METHASDEKEIRSMVEAWAAAVRAQDIDGVLAHHTDDFVMYDVPPPFQSVGLQEYKKTWELFWSSQKGGVIFEMLDLRIVAGSDVAFCFTPMRCRAVDEDNDQGYLNFRLTMGLEKRNGEWVIVHEHHSVPSK